jgi:hypothetical protein
MAGTRSKCVLGGGLVRPRLDRSRNHVGARRRPPDRYAINDDKRWRRFLFLVFLALTVVAGWWLLAYGGVQTVPHDVHGGSG